MTVENKVVVIGQGYVGLPLALAAAKAGWQVVGVEIDTAKFKRIESGDSTIESVESSEILELSKSGRYTIQNNFQCINEAAIVIICVPTPLNDLKEPDLTSLRLVIQEMIPRLRDGTLVINESTSYPGTLKEEFERVIKKARPDIETFYAVAPERVDPGNPIFNHKNTPRIIGGTSPTAISRAKTFYETICDNVVVCGEPETAEMAKLLENSFRLVNISLINEIATICTKLNIDVWDVIKAASTKPFGFMPFKPGIGIGGHCIPIDPIYLNWYADKSGEKSSLIALAAEINSERTSFYVKKIEELTPITCEIVVCGIGYKYATSDVRESPSLDLMRKLRTIGYKVSWCDPYVLDWKGECSSIEFSSATLVVIHPYLDITQIEKHSGIILDTSGVYRNNPRVIQI